MSQGVALGFVETRGNTGAVQALDVMLKTYASMGDGASHATETTFERS